MPKTKYFYQGMPLIEYCRLHNLDYPYIYARIRRMEKNKIVITEEIMHEIVSKAKRKMKVYMFKGMPLNTYCKKFNISYKRVYRKIKKLESLNIVISEEILEKIIKAVQNTTTFQIIYYWEGMPLIEYCKLHNIPYDDILWRIKHDDRDVSLSIKIGTAIELYLPKGIKYYVGDMPFIEFCKKENLSYDLGIRLLRRKYEMPYVIQYLRKRKDKILQKEIKEFLLTNLNHEDLLLDFAQENHFSITNVKNVIKEGIPLGNAIMLIFYLGTENEFHLKSISMKTVKEVVSLLKKNERLSLEELLLLDGMGFIEYRYFIKKEMTNLIRATLARHISTSEGIYRNAYQYLENSIDYVLEANFINNPGSFTNYCKKVFFGWLMRFLKELVMNRNLGQNNVVDSFDLENYYIQKERNQIIYQAIANLSQEEQKYVFIKYGFWDNQEKTDEEMSQYFPDLLPEDLIIFEKNILQKLAVQNQIRLLR